MTESENRRVLEGDRARWGDPKNYQASWAQRAEAAARFVPDNASVLEIGVGLGAFRACVRERCRYVGADLVPLDPETLPVDLERDPLPAGTFDYIVMLGVLEYIRFPEQALAKASAAARTSVLSYCHVNANFAGAEMADVILTRRARGWLNDLSREDLLRITKRIGWRLQREELFNADANFTQTIFLLERDG